MRAFLSVVTVAALYTEHWSELCAYLKRNFGAGPPEPEDVAQATFVRFVQLEQREDIRNPRAFLQRMAYNIAVSELRKARTHDKYLADGLHQIAAAQGNDLTGERVLLAIGAGRGIEATSIGSIFVTFRIRTPEAIEGWGHFWGYQTKTKLIFML